MSLFMLIEGLKVYFIITLIFGFIIDGVLALSMVVTTGYVDPKLMLTMLFFLIGITIIFLTALFSHLVKKKRDLQDEDD
ncbi:hypothetical protein [Paenibacillus sp.]|uniref:hypothetical protein n=1 Tax=Paenibacillus sp. TaxID=58172 RepID=UPI0028A98071|nr:hypothetical protein [Paenibacillus sp.]